MNALVWCRPDQTFDVLAASGPEDFGGARPSGEQLWLWTGGSFRRLTNDEALALALEQRMPWEEPAVIAEASGLSPDDRATIQIAFITGVPCWSPSMAKRGWLAGDGRLSSHGRAIAEESLRQEGLLDPRVDRTDKLADRRSR